MRSNVFAALFWLGVAGLVLVSLIPNVSMPVTTIDAGIRVRISWEILGHLLGFALLGWLYVKAYGFSVWGVVLFLGLAVAGEVIQFLFTSGRNAEIRDIVWNVVGTGLGVLIERVGRWISGGVAA
jgi:VanZ family protein